MVNDENSYTTEGRPYLRYAAAIIVTLTLFVMFVGLIVTHDDFIIFLFILAYVGTLFISIPITGLWLYSLFKSLFAFRHNKAERKLFYFHCVDILLIIFILLFSYNDRCDAEIMEKHYSTNANRMRELVHDLQQELPDSTFFITEFESFGRLSNDSILTKDQQKQLSRNLKKVGCIGIEISNTGKLDYTTLRFKRIGMGIYSFRLYDRPLSQNEQDSLNNDYQLIVFNDSTVFEYGGGVFGVQTFLGKDEYLKKHNHTN